MSNLEKAIKIAVSAHEGQIDRAGAPYILHVLSVMMKGCTDEEKIVGVLHDVVEDTEWSFDALKKEGFDSTVIEALKCVTKIEGEDYETFVKRTAQNKLAIRVKLNDLESNMDIKRLKKVGEKEIDRINKYIKAYNFLKDQLK